MSVCEKEKEGKKKKEILPFLTAGIMLPGGHYAIISQKTQKDKYSMILLICGVYKSGTSRTRGESGGQELRGRGGEWRGRGTKRDTNLSKSTNFQLEED